MRLERGLAFEARLFSALPSSRRSGHWWRRWPRVCPGVSTRKVKAITEELCGHAFSASSISAINKRLDESLKAFAERPHAFSASSISAINKRLDESLAAFARRPFKSRFLTSSSMRATRRCVKPVLS
ncbi:hypothetical protein X747_15220 [Mesorhizobium sp. LNJC384A00]|nr:hypothetical protein X747_15220 [Mesorhizobium sp. LNJC384A00]